jgi:hypothetical protein
MKIRFGNELLEQKNEIDISKNAVKDYSNGKWRKILSAIGNAAIGAAYATAGITAASVAATTGFWLYAGQVILFFLIAGTYGLVIKALLLGTDNALRRNPKMKKLFSLAMSDSRSKDIINDIKKELDTGKADKEKIKYLKKELISRLKELEDK